MKVGRSLAAAFVLLAALFLGDAASAAQQTVSSLGCTRTGSNDSVPATIGATTTRQSTYAACGKVGVQYRFTRAAGPNPGTFTTQLAHSSSSTVNSTMNCNCAFHYSLHWVGVGGTGPWGSGALGFTLQP